VVVGEHQFTSLKDRLKAVMLAALIRALRCTWRTRKIHRCIYDQAIKEGGAVLAFWHGDALSIVALHRCRNILGLTSLSADGELAAGVLWSLGYGVVRGSSSRGGPQAREACEAALKQGLSTSLAVDGPRGPRHRVKPGAVSMSAAANVPIIIAAVRSSFTFRLRSWDGFEIPLPGSKVSITYGRLEPVLPGQATQSEGVSALETKMCALSGEFKT
jgi:lysophospholipid acyltransferase (LPLAT)-like uncharacterized protein